MDKIKLSLLLLAGMLIACGNQQGRQQQESSATNTQVSTTRNTVPAFNADSAYAYVDRQVTFGPRVPNTPAHKACGDYLINELKRFGAQLHVQEASLTAFNGTKLEARNIIGIYNPEAKRRILLFAHWDSRPFADQDPDPSNYHTPIDGANDGASGVGVLLEIARLLKDQPTEAGIDIIFFDAEDYGEPAFDRSYMQNTWCLGSQFWAKNPHVKNYKAEFGILLDMVGDKDASFYKEGFSTQYAAPIVEMIWEKARDLGYGRYFINERSGAITDDHEYVIRGRGIPCVDIIHLDLESHNGFSSHWHTVNDTMENINRETLKAVGQTVLEIIYAN